MLARTNAKLLPLESALADADVPYTITGAERFFERAEVREAVVRLRAVNASAVADGPRGILDAVDGVLSAMGFDHKRAPSGRGTARERWESLAAIRDLVVAQANRVDQVESISWAQVLAEIERRASVQSALSPDAVTLATLHTAKGLEWDVVVLPGLVEGNLPISYAKTIDDRDEERRLLYVGMTRARSVLRLTYPRKRPSGTSTKASPFLAELGLVGADEQPRGQRRTRQKRAMSACRLCGKSLIDSSEKQVRRCRACPQDIDREILERLRAWRLAASKASDKPAFTILHDKTLEAIAELRAQTDEQLSGIAGIGPAKLDRYGSVIVALVKGLEVDEADLDQATAAAMPPSARDVAPALPPS